MWTLINTFIKNDYLLDNVYNFYRYIKIYLESVSHSPTSGHIQTPSACLKKISLHVFWKLARVDKLSKQLCSQAASGGDREYLRMLFSWTSKFWIDRPFRRNTFDKGQLHFNWGWCVAQTTLKNKCIFLSIKFNTYLSPALATDRASSIRAYQ